MRFVVLAVIGILSARAQENVANEARRQGSLWEILKRSLSAPDGEKYFDSSVKDGFIPGGVNGLDYLAGTVIRSEPQNHPRELVLGISDSQTPEVTLNISFRNGTRGLAKPVPRGTKVAFAGVAKAFTKEPFNLVFEVEMDRPSYFPVFKVLEQNERKK